MTERTLPRTYLHAEHDSGRSGPLRRLRRGLTGMLLSPLYWGLAWTLGTPGLAFRRRCTAFGIRQVFTRIRTLSWREMYELLVYPMDSVRYFEFEFAWRALGESACSRYLDVSSPRLLPLLWIRNQWRTEAVLLNPDPLDLAVTRRFAQALRIEARCRFADNRIETGAVAPECFDTITSLSVLEHIPDDAAAVRSMWSLLKPGGQLILTLPCAATASEEYINDNKYGLLEPNEDGFIFWQRYYDMRMLRERVFATTGPAVEMRVYGEKRPGLYANNVEQKMHSGSFYAHWREPYMVGKHYCEFDSIEQLPGMGVVGLRMLKARCEGTAGSETAHTGAGDDH